MTEKVFPILVGDGHSTITELIFIPTICAALNPRTVSRQFVALPLQCIPPFRLIGLFKSRRQIKEWQWNLKTLIEIDHDWQPRQWISSGFDEPTAQEVRGRYSSDF